MYIVQVQYHNGEVVIIGRYDNILSAQKKKSNAEQWCAMEGGEVSIVTA